MRILLLTHRLPWPIEVGQNHRLYYLARHLAPRHELFLFALGEPPYAPEIASLFGEIHTLPVPAVAPQPWLLRKLAGAVDPHRMVERSAEMDRLIRHVMARVRPEVIWVGGWDMLVHCAQLDGPPVVADAMDEGLLESMVVARSGRPFGRAVVRLLQDPIARTQLGKKGRETALTRYAWEQQAQSLEAILRNP
jgi:hypothetical protein